MLYTPLTKEALKLCFEAHAEQLDKAGIPYVNHPLHLAEQMHTEDETCVALLHDVMEDCGRTQDDLRAIGISERSIEALVLLTHEESVPYLDYVRALRDNDIARKVKLADLCHNSEAGRLSQVSDEDRQRLRKYMEARVILGDMTYELETPVGAVGVEVNGRAYPFSLENESGERFTFYEEDPDCAREEDRDPIAGSVDKCYRIGIETLPLAVGDAVRIVYNFGEAVVWGSDEHVTYNVYRKGDYSIGVGVYDDEHGISHVSHAFRLRDREGAYEIAEDPAEHRYHPYAHEIEARIAWKEGASESDARIVRWAAGW